ncbi:phosphoribosyl-ATP diphosphatase [Roseospira visakhapatnamensis]|uniref:Phosphoribosyl-ATP pyrophosphatase n=1 Tax=Roseospira visakhapatnamensis TaxID=390880 RepID=A0A7W6WAW8_9PROT|nr:phosphoribosyl-ATP diphosphatase [Roseospira visakhapatnamensis]MBB4266942.1 phosphoribosyl-ATP pyrophosphohydrolase [Roseospira visakhapatnamensis]
MTAPEATAPAPDARVLDRLYEVVTARKGADPSDSYTAKLFAKGRGKICQKFGEEATETIVAALAEGPDHVVTESADLLYHLSVLWAEAGVAPDRVWAELARRFGTSGLTEKAARTAE